MKYIFWFSFLVFTSVAQATLITNEDFESGSAIDWSNNTVTNGGVNFTQFLGRFGIDDGNITKSYGLSGTQTFVTIEFDFYEIDSWDNETFNFRVDGVNIFSDNIQHGFNDFGTVNNSAVSSSDNGLTDLGFNSAYPDQRFHYAFTINTTSTTLNIEFFSTLNQPLNDESWGIDNLVITDNSTVPEPSGIFLLGLLGIGFYNKKYLEQG